MDVAGNHPARAAAKVPATKPKSTPPSRAQVRGMAWATSNTAMTRAANAPPAQAGAAGATGATIPKSAEGIRVNPINSTTTPLTSGVNTLRKRGRNGASTSCTGAAASERPSMSAGPPA